MTKVNVVFIGFKWGKSMKSLIFSALILISLNTSANEYYCQKAYQTKIERINKKAILRHTGTFVVTGALGWGVLVSGIGLPALIFGAPAGTIGFIATVMGASYYLHSMDEKFVKSTFNRAINLNREKGLRAAIQLIDTLQYTEEELKALTYKEYQKIDPYIHFNDFKQVTLMDVMLEKVNRKRARKDKELFSYEDLRKKLLLLSQTSAFCPMRSGKNRPKTIRQIKKLIDRLD